MIILKTSPYNSQPTYRQISPKNTMERKPLEVQLHYILSKPWDRKWTDGGNFRKKTWRKKSRV